MADSTPTGRPSNDRTREESKRPTQGLSDRLTRFQIQSGLSARALEMFVVTARTGSMSAAADELELTQPAVSQNIAALETALDVQLFDRSTRPPALTLQGAALLQHAIAILDALKRFEGALRLGQSARLPMLKIGMPNSVATTIGPQVVQFLKHLADEMSIDSGFAATRFQALSRREFDFLVTPDESQPPPDIQTIPFLTEPLMVIAPRSYGGDIQDLARLSQSLDFISFGRDANLARRLNTALHDKGITLQRRYHLDTNEAVLQMVAAGSGWTVLSVLAVIRFIERAEPIQVALYPQELNRKLVVAFRRGEGVHLAGKIHDAAIESLKASVLPVVREKLGPEIAKRINLHEASN